MAVVAGSTSPLKTEELVLKPDGYQPLDPAKKVRLGVVGGGFGSRMFWNFEPNYIVHAVSNGVDLVFIADCNEDGGDHLQLETPGLEKKGGPPLLINRWPMKLAMSIRFWLCQKSIMLLSSVH